MKRDRRVNTLLALSLAAASTADAGLPLVTDDAAVVAPKTCQLEVWTVPSHSGHEHWAQPACNFTGNVEFAVAGAQLRPDDGERSSGLVLQAKAVLFPRGDGEWSFGAVGGAARDTGQPHGRSAFQGYYGKALASWYPRDELEIDLNLGLDNVYGTGTFGLWGAAIQYSVRHDLQLLAETFRDEPGRAKYQVGTRWSVVPDRFDAYASYGNRFGAPPRGWWAIVGIRLQTPRFLP